MAKEKILVLGAGESGTGAALLAASLGYEVFVSDARTLAAPYRKELQEAAISWEEGGHNKEQLLAWHAKTVIKSPGIPDTLALVQALEEQGAELIDEIEFAARYCKAKIVAITGSNGKTTTTLLCYHLLKEAGLSVGLGGNVGQSFAKQLIGSQKDVYVLEISSFQLDRCYQFRPNVAVLLNITPDHLDRYGYDYNKYIAAKWRITQAMQAEDLIVYNRDSPALVLGLENYYKGQKQSLCPLGMAKLNPEAKSLELAEAAWSFELQDIALKGRHNLFNMLAAARVAYSLGLSQEQVFAGLKSFRNESHRLEWVCDLAGVSYINDSKATNIDSVYYALEAMSKPVVWIVGGQDKGNDYSKLFELVEQKVRALVCLGLDNSPIQKAFAGRDTIVEETRSMGEAIKVASLYAEAGDVVLLSPACASFDLFRNYKERGDSFRNILLQQQQLLTEGQQIGFEIALGTGQQQSDKDARS